MKYPLADEYHQALQNPIQCFSDYQLRYGSIQADALGLPRVRSGNFASVYKVYSADGDYAVKCFLNPPEDLDHRYECIGRYLQALHTSTGSHAEPQGARGVARSVTHGVAPPMTHGVAPPMTHGVAPPMTQGVAPSGKRGHFIDFKYYRKGIALNGGVFPLLRMEWVDAVSLDKHIAGLAEQYDRQAILDLRDKFVELYSSLRLRGISHGDLQHGNILVTKDGLKLIDYDGMYVPGIRLGHSPDVGHPNYQHPKRKPTDYNEMSDGFSALVIYTALSILAYDPRSWRRFYNGDNILFTEKDFLNTNQSPLFRHIKEIPIDAIREATNTLAWSCLRPFAQMPDILEIVGNGISPPEAARFANPSGHLNHAWIKTYREADTGDKTDAGATSSGMFAAPLTFMPSVGAYAPQSPHGASPLAVSALTAAGNPAITCPSCRSANDEFAALCSRCAYPLSMSSAAANEAAPVDYLPSAGQEEVVCPQCNALNEQSLAFCKMCGRILGSGSYETTSAASGDYSSVERPFSLITKFKWTMIYFALFFFLISSLDYARNERIGPFAPKPPTKTGLEIMSDAAVKPPPAAVAAPLSASPRETAVAVAVPPAAVNRPPVSKSAPRNAPVAPLSVPSVPSASPRETAVAVAVPPDVDSAPKPANRAKPSDFLRKLFADWGARATTPASRVTNPSSVATNPSPPSPPTSRTTNPATTEPDGSATASGGSATESK
jgi:serine/threonine protein kinase